MEENKITQENQALTVESNGSETENSQKNGGDNTPTETIRTFTQDEVNEIVRQRLEKSKKTLYSKYGVEDSDGLDELLGKAQAHDAQVERIEELRRLNASQSEELAFLKNNVDPSRYDDVRTYFKGKELEFNNDNLVIQLATHPEWIKQAHSNTTSIQIMGGEKKAASNPTVEDEKAIASRLFGFEIK